MGAHLGKTGLCLPAAIPAHKGSKRQAPAGCGRPSASKSIPLLSSWIPTSLLRASKRGSRGPLAPFTRHLLSTPRRRYLLQQAHHFLLGPLAAGCWKTRQMKALSRRLCSGVTPRIHLRKGTASPPPGQEQTTSSCPQAPPSRNVPNSKAGEPLANGLQDEITKVSADKQGSVCGPQHKRQHSDSPGAGKPPLKLPRSSPVLMSQAPKVGFPAWGSHQALEEKPCPSSGRSLASGDIAGKPGSSLDGLSCGFGSSLAMAELCKRPGPVSFPLLEERLSKKVREDLLPCQSRSSAAAVPLDTEIPADTHGEASNKVHSCPATTPCPKRRVQFQIHHSQPSCATSAEAYVPARPGPTVSVPTEGHGQSFLPPRATHTTMATSSCTQATATEPGMGSIGSPNSGPLSGFSTQPAAPGIKRQGFCALDTASSPRASVPSATDPGTNPPQSKAIPTYFTAPRSFVGAPLAFDGSSLVSMDGKSPLSKIQASPSSVAATCSSSPGFPSSRSPSPASVTREASLSFHHTARPAFKFPSASRIMPTLRVPTRVRTKLAFEDKKPVLPARLGSSLILGKAQATHTHAELGPATATGQRALSYSTRATLSCQGGPASTFVAPASKQPSLGRLLNTGCGTTSQAKDTSTVGSRLSSFSQVPLLSGCWEASAATRGFGFSVAAPGTSSSSGAFSVPVSIPFTYGCQQSLCWSFCKPTQDFRRFGPSGFAAPCLAIGVAPQGREAQWQYTSKK